MAKSGRLENCGKSRTLSLDMAIALRFLGQDCFLSDVNIACGLWVHRKGYASLTQLCMVMQAIQYRLQVGPKQGWQAARCFLGALCC